MIFVSAAFAANQFSPAYRAELYAFFVPASGAPPTVLGFSVGAG